MFPDSPSKGALGMRGCCGLTERTGTAVNDEKGIDVCYLLKDQKILKEGVLWLD